MRTAGRETQDTLEMKTKATGRVTEITIRKKGSKLNLTTLKNLTKTNLLKTSQPTAIPDSRGRSRTRKNLSIKTRKRKNIKIATPNDSRGLEDSIEEATKDEGLQEEAEEVHGEVSSDLRDSFREKDSRARADHVIPNIMADHLTTRPKTIDKLVMKSKQIKTQLNQLL